MKPSRAAIELLAAEFHPTPESRTDDEERARFDTAASLARRVPMRSIAVPEDLERLPEVAAALLVDQRASVEGAVTATKIISR